MPSVLITGASRGLGLEFARQYLQDGWRVYACSRSVSRELQQLASRGNACTTHPLDVADHAQIDALAASLAAQPLDVLLNNAGRFGRVGFASGGVADQAFGQSNFDDWDETFRVNVMGPMKMSQAFIEHVAASEQKKIITLTSMVGCMGLNTMGGMYAYRASKAAVNAVMHSMGIDLLPRGVLAIAIHPGWARTSMGGADAEIDSATSVRGVRQVIADLSSEDLGRVMAYDGEELPY